VKELREVTVDSLVNEIYISTAIVTEKKADNQPVTVSS